MNVSAIIPGIEPQFSSTKPRAQAAVPVESVSHDLPSRIRSDLPSQPAERPSELDDAQLYREQAQLRISSRFAARHNENGTSLVSKSRLKYQYQLEAADGSQIKLNANLKVKSSLQQQGDTLKIKSSVQFQLSVAQTSVEDGFGELFGSGLNNDQSGGLSSLLQDFGNALAAIGDAFNQSDPLDGDQLITDVVDAFNQLSASARALLFGGNEQIEAAPDNPQLPDATVSNLPETIAVPENSEPALETAPPEAAPIEPAPVDELIEEPVKPAAEETQRPDAETAKLEILAKVRFSFKASVERLISSFDVAESESGDDDGDDDDGDDDDGDERSEGGALAVRSKTRFDAQISAYARFQLSFDQAHLPQQVDTPA